MNDRDAARARKIEQRAKIRGANVAADPELAHLEIIEHGGKAAKMIFVTMRQRNYVEPLDTARP
jgi:hypothetical protein